LPPREKGARNEPGSRVFSVLHRRQVGRPESFIKPVEDRPGHDRRYSLDTGKLRGLGWTPTVSFEEGLAATVAWYRENDWWWRPIKEQDPTFREYYRTQNTERGTSEPRERSGA